MTDETYADGISGIQITGSVIRIDFASHDVPENQTESQSNGNKPPLVPRQRIVMTLDGFGHSFGMLEQVMRKLVDDGVFQRSDTSGAVAPAKGKPAKGKSGGKSGGSPNF